MPSCQAARDVGASQDVLIDIFDCIETFFRRLETYAAVPTTYSMLTRATIDVIVQTTVDVLRVLTIATEEVMEGSGRKSILFVYITAGLLYPETYIKLLENADIASALKRLDKLTRDEAEMIRKRS
jgi:hypothetical protein